MRGRQPPPPIHALDAGVLAGVLVDVPPRRCRDPSPGRRVPGRGVAGRSPQLSQHGPFLREGTVAAVVVFVFVLVLLHQVEWKEIKR